MPDPAVLAPDAPARDYYQYPQPFPLPDIAKAPDGKQFTGHRARVYWLLRITRERGYQHYVGRHLAPPGTVPVFLFREPWSGGQSGGRRVRELREYGVEVQISAYTPPDGVGSETTLYELVVDPIAGGVRQAAQPRTAGPQRAPEPALEKPGARGDSAGTHPARTGAARPLSSVRFAFGSERSEATEWLYYDLTPGAPGALAPAAGVTTEAAYIEQLRRAWDAGKFTELGWGGRGLLFHDTPLLRPPFDVRAALTRVLEACGARLVEGL